MPSQAVSDEAEVIDNWRKYKAEEMEHHFSPLATNPDAADYFKRWGEWSRAAFSSPSLHRDIPYAAGELKSLDIYLPASGKGPFPVHFFIHGGYWRALSKNEFAWVGKELASAGFVAVVIDYPKCPAVALDAVVAGALDAFEWCCKNISTYGGDPNRITLSGHSCGAHLGAAIMAEDWTARGLQGELLQGAVLISGIFNPAVAMHISVQDDLHLTAEIAERYNFCAHPPRLSCPVYVMVGGSEPEGWKGLSAGFACHLKRNGRAVEYLVCGQENHFSIIDQMQDSSSEILSAMLKLKDV